MESVLRYLDWTSVGLALLGGLLSLVLLEIFRFNSFRRRFPPGPKSLPYVGNVMQLFKEPMDLIRSMENYGEMSCLFVGRKPMIVLNKMEIVKEAFVNNGSVFSGRPQVPLLEWVTNGLGIVMAPYGNSWKQQRRFALHTLRDFGLGKKSVEERVAEEARYLVEEMLKHEGKAFFPIHPIMNSVSNIICSIVFGDRFDYEDKRFAHLLKLLNEYVGLPGSMIGQQKAMEESTFHEENMIISTTDLFLAGTDTTATTLRWGLIYMMDHPDVQERCHEEIVRVLGFDRSPCMDDRAQLPYTHATIHEILRCSNIIPIGPPHETTQSTQLHGYHIPAGTQILANSTAIMTDRNHWKHPDVFNPENFLDEKGQFCKNDFFLPFSMGQRVCLGESLARTELFIFFTSLIQRLKFSWPPGEPRPNMNGIMGLVRCPFPYNTICSSRETTH
ncbi:cytochrome P450 2J5 isoform X2 [Astyanax mexicanus]|uniref:cytochrome P450 2J5 isoform X2 n=1 Tax=Astyanax mexicanus TaxID=7994 RepID=UPI0020CAFAFC|nr:cytochrome P450 2J5 isoform X2 [Astyanax mexicanus]